MNIHEKIDIASQISDLINHRIENIIGNIVEDSTTIAVMYGYYTAHREILESVLASSPSKEDAYNKLVTVVRGYEAFDVDSIDARLTPLDLLRIYLEDYVRERVMPDKSDALHDIIEMQVDNYDWCDAASTMEDYFLNGEY